MTQYWHIGLCLGDALLIVQARVTGVNSSSDWQHACRSIYTDRLHCIVAYSFDHKPARAEVHPIAQAKPTAKFGGLHWVGELYIVASDPAPVAASHACGNECESEGALTDGSEMELQGDCIRFAGAVLGGLRTSGSRTFRVSGTAVVVAQEETENLLIAQSGRVSGSALPHRSSVQPRETLDSIRRHAFATSACPLEVM